MSDDLPLLVTEQRHGETVPVARFAQPDDARDFVKHLTEDKRQTWRRFKITPDEGYRIIDKPEHYRNRRGSADAPVGTPPTDPRVRELYESGAFGHAKSILDKLPE